VLGAIIRSAAPGSSAFSTPVAISSSTWSNIPGSSASLRRTISSFDLLISEFT